MTAEDALREQIARQIEEFHDAEERRLGSEPGLVGNYLGGIKEAARIARGGAA